MKNAANHVTNIALELGGKNPNIIFDDADFELAVIDIKWRIFPCRSSLFSRFKNFSA